MVYRTPQRQATKKSGLAEAQITPRGQDGVHTAKEASSEGASGSPFAAIIARRARVCMLYVYHIIQQYSSIHIIYYSCIYV